MQILIDMPDEDYDFIKGAEKARYFTPEYYVDLILNGVPLPEHHEKIKEDLRRYEADCKFASDDSSCGICLDNIFGSFERMLDRHLTATKDTEKEFAESIIALIPHLPTESDKARMQTATEEKSCENCGQPRDYTGQCILFKEGKCVDIHEKWKPATEEGE